MGIEDERNNENLNAAGLRQYMELREVTMSQQGTTETETSPYLEINEYAPLHPGTRSWEVPRETVVIEKVIGKGAFGEVAQGRASQLQGREVVGTVAVKMLKGNLPLYSIRKCSKCRPRYTVLSREEFIFFGQIWAEINP